MKFTPEEIARQRELLELPNYIVGKRDLRLALDEIERLREALESLRWELKVIRAVAGNKANDKADKAVIIGLVNDALKGGGDE